MADNQINLILKLILAGDFEKAASLLRGLVVETTELEKAANKAGGTENSVAKEKLSNLEKIRRALKETQEAQKLLTEAASAEDEAAAFELLVEARKKLSKVVDETNKTEETGNKKKLADIRQLQQQLQVLTEKQKQLQQAVKSGDTGKGAELSSVTAQVGALQAKITALRTGQQQLTQSSQAVQSSFQQTVTLAEGLSGKFQALTQATPALSQGFNGVGGALINVAKSLGPVGLAVGAAVAAFSLGSSAAIKFGEDTAFAAKTQLAIQRSTGTSASFIGALTTIIKSYGGEVQNVQELLLQTGSVINTAVSNPVGESAERFKKLGIEVRDAAGKAKSIETVLREIDKVASSTALTTEQLTIVSGIFGEEASKQFLDQVGNFAKIEERLKKTGAIISDELKELSRKYNEAGQLIQAQTDGITFSLGGEILPYLLDIRQYASDAIAAVDPEDLNGIKAIIGDIGGVLKTLATTSVDFGSTAINVIGNLATGFDALLNPIDSVRAILGIYPVVTDKAEGSQQKLTKAFVSGTFAAEELSKRINQLANDQKFLGDITATIADTQILAVQQRLRQGLIDEQTAADEISRLEKRKVDQKAGFEEDKLKKVTKSLDEEIKRRQDAAKQEDKILQDITARKQQAQKELTKIKEEAFQSEVALESFAGKSKQGEEELRKEKEKNATLISLAQQRFNQLNRAEQEATINSQKASKDLADLKAGTNLAILVDEKKLKDDVLKLRNDLQSATLGLEQSRLAKRKQTDEEIKKSEQSIVVARDKSIRDINVLEANALKELQAKILAGSVSRTQAEQEALAIKLKFDKDRLLSENDALIKINGLNGASEEVKTKLKQDASTRRQSIDKQEFDQGVKLAQDAANARKALLEAESAQRQADINKRKAEIIGLSVDTVEAVNLYASEYQKAVQKQLEEINKLSRERAKAIAQAALENAIAQDALKTVLGKIQLEKDNLLVLQKQGATKEELEAAQGKINLLVSEEVVKRAELVAKEKEAINQLLSNLEKERQARKQLNDEKLAAFVAGAQAAEAENQAVIDRSDRELSAVAALKGGVIALGDAFDINTAKLDELDSRIEQLNQHADFIRNVAAIPDKDVFLREIENTLTAINQRKVDLTQKADLQAAAERQRIDLEKAAETNRKLVEEVEKREQEILRLKKERRKDERELDEDRAEEAESFNSKLKQLEKDLALDLKEIAEKQANEEKDIKDRAIREEEERLREIAELKKKAAEEAATAANSIELGSLAERLKLQEQINAEKDPKKQLELKNKLAEAEGKVDRASRKAAELAALEKEDLSKEEFEARKDAIEAKFRLEEDAATERLKLAEVTDEKLRRDGLARLEQLLKEQQVRNQKALEDKLSSIKEAATREAKQAEEERAKRAAEYAQQAKDRQSAFDKAKVDEEKDHKDRVAALDARQKEIRAKYKETYDDINKRSVENAAQIGATAKAIQDAFGLSDEAAKKYLATLNKIGEAQGTINPGGSSPSASSASSTPSAGSSSTSSTTSSSSPFSSPGSNPNNTAGQIGTPSAAPGGKSATSDPGNNNSGLNKSSSSSQSSSSSSSDSSSSSQTSPSSSSTSSSSSSSRQKDQNKSQGSEGSGGGSYPSIPDEIKTGDEYKGLVGRILEALLAKAGVKDVNAPGSGDVFLKGKKGNQLEAEARQLGGKAFRNYALTALRENSDLKDKAEEIYAKQINNRFAGGIEANVISILVTIDFKDGKGFTNLKSNRKRHADFADQVIAIVEPFRKSPKGDKEKFGSKGDIASPTGSTLGGAGTGSGDGDKGNDGFGDKGKPTAPGAPQPSPEPKNQVALARERENFSDIEEKNAETGAGLTGPNFPGAPDNPPSSDDESESGVDPSSTTPPSDPTNQPSKPSSNITRRSDNFDGNRSVAGDSQPITATATIEKFINIENQTVIVNPSSATDKQEITKEMANSMIDAIIPLIPDRRDLVSILNAELDAKNTTDFASRNPLRAYKV